MKLLTMTLLAMVSVFAYAGTNMTVRFNDCSTASYTTVTTVNGVSLNGYSYGQNSYPVEIKSKSATIDGVSFTKAVYFKGAPHDNYITISFEVDGPCTIKTYGTTSNSSTNRAHAIYKESIASSNKLAESNASTSNETITYNYTGEATTIYIASTNGGYYIYGIDVTYGENSGSGGNEQTQTLYTVTFNANSNGTCSTSSLTEASEGAGVTLPTVTANSGYNFLGWSTSSTATTASYTAGATYNPSANITLYAVYESTNTYPTAGSAMTFDATKRYSEWVINSRLNDFKANTNNSNFGVFGDDGTQITAPSMKKTTLDYVPGLVAKAVLEAVDYYKNDNDVNVKPWFYAVQSYAERAITSEGIAGESFDDLNAVKLYFKLQELATSQQFADAPTITNANSLSTANTRFSEALAGIKIANEKYAIKESLLPDAAGGWFHKSSYTNQMWCDGQYMGPALLAQMLNEYDNYETDGYIAGSKEADWDLITKQFTISWNYLWNPDVKLLYHAFTADPAGSAASSWYGISSTPGSEIYHSAEYWGRAEGWYFLALVDVLEQMQIAGMTKTQNYATLRSYLNQLAEGIAAKQDATSGCWYQLLNHDGSFVAQSYSGKKYTSTPVANYLESSASAIFTAAYLKGMRLGLYDTDYTAVATKAYQGIIENFMVADGNGGVHLVHCSKSAGLGGGDNRDGSAEYYLMGKDTEPTVADPLSTSFYTEGKVFGGFILAATEYERRFIDKKLELSENGSYTEFPVGEYDEVTLSRSFPTDQWTTMTVPFSISAEQVKTTFGDGTEIAKVDRIENSKLYFSKQSAINANEPVLIKVGSVSESGSYTFNNVTVENSTTLTQAGNGVQLNGNYTLLTGGQNGDLGAEQYFIYNDLFYDCTYMNRMKPFRAYITATAAAGAKQLKLEFCEDEEEATAVNAAAADDTTAADAVTFNAAGQQTSDKHGLLIQRGKKTLK
ncbi:MAG: glycoside hydrolase family 88 protein [Prevotella sp.]|nr:glycoside hydrolase family 88 protein [Prevotella sp.]